MMYKIKDRHVEIKQRLIQELKARHYKLALLDDQPQLYIGGNGIECAEVNFFDDEYHLAFKPGDADPIEKLAVWYSASGEPDTMAAEIFEYDDPQLVGKVMGLLASPQPPR